MHCIASCARADRRTTPSKRLGANLIPLWERGRNMSLPNHRTYVTGFNLVELMITVVVIAILAVIVYPSYESYMQHGCRSNAERLMSLIARREEQYMLDARSYTVTIGAGGA